MVNVKKYYDARALFLTVLHTHFCLAGVITAAATLDICFKLLHESTRPLCDIDLHVVEVLYVVFSLKYFWFVAFDHILVELFLLLSYCIA